MSYYDDDYGYEMGAIETERFDADLEMAEMARWDAYSDDRADEFYDEPEWSQTFSTRDGGNES